MNWIKTHRLLSLLILVCMGFFAYYIYYAIRWIPYPNSVDYGEGYVMYYAKLWANGAWKWNINVPPYLTMVYGLGYPILIEPLVKIFGAQLWVGRAVSFASALISCVFIYLIVKKLTGKKSYGLLAALIPATQPVFRDWSLMARVDMPAVMFDIIGFYIILKYKDSKWFYLSLVFFICAMMIKVSTICGLAAAVIYLIIYNRKQIPIFLGLFVVGLTAVIIPLMTISNGEYLKHILVYQNTIQNVNILNAYFLLNVFIYPFLILLVLAIIYLRKCWGKKEYALAGIFFISSFVINMVATLKAGSAAMYYLEAILAVSICVPLALPYLIAYFKEHGWQIHTATIFIVLAVIFGFYGLRHNVSFPNNQYNQSVKEAQSIMSDSQKPLIIENTSIALTMNRPLYIEFFVFTNLTRLGYWDETSYLNEYNSQYFDYVLLRVSLDERMAYPQGDYDGDFTAETLQAIKNKYTLVYEHGGQWYYSMYLYEADNKFATDNRTIVREFVNK